MKKIMFGLGAALALVACADIESSNVVGYTSKEAPKGKFQIIGAGFEAVSGGMAINEILSGVEGVDYGDGKVFRTTASQIQIPNTAGGYSTYYFLNDGWFDNGTADGDVKVGWCDGAGNLVDAELTAGVAAWFKSVSADGTATIAGQVPEDDSAEISCPATFALRANVFPKAVTLNTDDMTSSDIVGVDYGDGKTFRTTAAQVQIPNAAGGYNTYYYLNDGWFDNGTADGDVKAGWCDGAGNLVDTQIPAGQGFWTKGVSGPFTLKFAK